MSSWFGDGLTSLKGQLTNFAKALSEETEPLSGGESSRTALWERPEKDKAAKSSDTSPDSSLKKQESTGESGSSGWTNVQLFHPVHSNDSSFNYDSNVPRREQQVQTDCDEDQTSLIAALQDRIEQLSQENVTLYERVDTLSQENVSLSMNVASLGRAAAELEAQVAVSQDENANLSTGLEELDIQHQRAIENIIVVRDETQKEYEILKVRYAELEKEMNNLRKEAEEKSHEKENEKSWKTELVSELEERYRELECLDSENASLRETVRDLIKEQEESRKETLATITEQDGEEVEALEKQIDQLKKDLSGQQKIQEDKDKEIRELKVKLADLSQESEKNILQIKEHNLNVAEDEIKKLEKQVVDLENKLSFINNAKLESEALIEHLESQLNSSEKSNCSTLVSEEQEKCKCLEKENLILHSKMGQLESRLLEMSDQKDNLLRECELKDRKMCQILLESNAAEQECKSELEKQINLCEKLDKDFSAFKDDMDKKLKEKELEIDNLNNRIQANNEIIVSDAINPELNEKLSLLEQENENLMSESAKMKLENDSLSAQIQSLNCQLDKSNKDLEILKNECETLKKRYDFDIRTTESKINELSQESQQYQIDKEVFIQKELELKNQLKLRDDEINAFKIFKQQSDVSLKEKVASVEAGYKNIISDLESKLEILRNQLAERELHTSHLREASRSLEENIAEKNEELAETKKKLEEISNEKIKLTENLEDLNEKISALSSQKANLNSEQYEKERESFLRKIESITEQNAQLLSDVVRLNTEHSALKNQLIASHGEELKKLKDSISLKQNELKFVQENSIALCSELKSKLSQAESERDELFKNIQLKHNECIGHQTEVLRLSEILKSEQTKVESAVVEKAQLELKCERLKILETENEVLKKQSTEFGLEIKTLKEQLDNASDLIKEIKRTEAEGQSAEDNSTSKNCKCAEGCEKTQEELNKLSWALHNEQVNNKTLQRQLTDVKEKFEKSEVQLRRLQVHLVEIEQNQLEEQAEMEQMKAKLEVADERLRQSSTAFTSANIRANQQVESLTHQVQVMTETKEKLEAELSNAEDSVLKQQAAVTNLQAVLHQFQFDKQRDIEFETERLRQQLKESYEKYDQLNGELRKTMDQMSEMKKGLEAASRLSDQLDKKTQMIETLKSEATVLKEKLEKEKAKLNEIHSSVEGKIDRNLVKNLFVGYVLADDKSKAQVIRVLSSVLELDSEERKKLSLEPQTQKQQQSLTEAFIKFLELESQPKPHLVLSVPSTEGSVSRRTSQSSNSSVLLSAEATSSLSHSPVIPPYPGRSNHSILKDLLKDTTPGSSNSSS